MSQAAAVFLTHRNILHHMYYMVFGEAHYDFGLQIDQTFTCMGLWTHSWSRQGPTEISSNICILGFLETLITILERNRPKAHVYGDSGPFVGLWDMITILKLRICNALL